MQHDLKQSQQIEPARLDFSGTKTQMALGCALIVVTVIWIGKSSLGADFLLDDYLHIDYCNRAMHGDPSTLIQCLTGNWGGSDLMKSYRPIVSLSILIDFLIYHLNSWGYHLTNLILYALCAILVSLTTLEATGRMGNRAGAVPAIWAGLLFCVYPLHAESVSWIIGRVDLIATLFYVGSLFLFLRYRLTGVRRLSVWSLIAFGLALASKEIAISLPAAIFAYALFDEICKTPLQQSPKGRLISQVKSSIVAILPYLGVLMAFAIVRTALLGTAIGGYDNSPLGLHTLKSLKIFLDRESLIHILAPISQEYLPIKQMLPIGTTLFAIPFVVFMSSTLLLVDKNKALISRYAYLVAANLALAILALVPAFQIWHIYPNLVGSRLFFLSSAFVAMAQAHMIWSLWHIAASNKANRAWLHMVAFLPIVIFAVHAIWYQIDVMPFAAAGGMMRAAKTQFADMLEQSSSHKQAIMITNLPQDYKGAGLLGRSVYLRDYFIYRLGRPLPPDLVVLEEKPNGLPERMSQAAHDLLLRDSHKYLVYAPIEQGTDGSGHDTLLRKLCTDDAACSDLNGAEYKTKVKNVTMPALLKSRLNTKIEIALTDSSIKTTQQAPELLLDLYGHEHRLKRTLTIKPERIQADKVIYEPGYLRAFVFSEAESWDLRLNGDAQIKSCRITFAGDRAS